MFHFLDTISLISYALIFLCFTLPMIIAYILFTKPSRKIFLLDFACHKPPINQVITKEVMIDRLKLYSDYNENTLNFVRKIIQRSGVGDLTYFPMSHVKDPVDDTFEGSRTEVETVIFGVVDEVLAKTKVKCEDIGILVVNCCVFNMTPSISSMVVNKYNLRDDIASYNLSGMGCTAGLTAITLAKNLLQVYPNTYALVVSTESLTQQVYSGNDLSKAVINCVFRLGGAAMLLSNRPSDHRSSKYQLIHTVHNNTSRSDPSYSSVFQEEDDEGYLGVTVSKKLIASAVKVINTNIKSLGPLVLPTSEKIIYILKKIAIYLKIVETRPIVPDFKKAFDHFLPHVGMKSVLDALQKSLDLPDVYMEASRMTLYRFGNTSSSSIWYELAYVEAKKRVKKGDRVWQMAFGSGFKCCSVVWRAIRAVDYEEMNPWSDEIDEFPLDLGKLESDPTPLNKKKVAKSQE